MTRGQPRRVLRPLLLSMTKYGMFTGQNGLSSLPSCHRPEEPVCGSFFGAVASCCSEVDVHRPRFPTSEYVSMALCAPFSKIVGMTAMTNQVPKSCLTGTLSTGLRGSSFVELAPMCPLSVLSTFDTRANTLARPLRACKSRSVDYVAASHTSSASSRVQLSAAAVRAPSLLARRRIDAGSAMVLLLLLLGWVAQALDRGTVLVTGLARYRCRVCKTTRERRLRRRGQLLQRRHAAARVVEEIVQERHGRGSRPSSTEAAVVDLFNAIDASPLPPLTGLVNNAGIIGFDMPQTLETATTDASKR